MAEKDELIDVRRLIAETSVEELNRLAEDYFAQLEVWDYHLAKPFGSIDETPQLLINFAVVLQGLSLCPGMTVLEFGAGTCWASRFLSQLGCQTIAADVSETALRMGAELYKRLPLIGERPAPRFLHFDGHRFDLPDASVDRIICLDAFHHVPNPQRVLEEMARVLKVGGIAGFAEPGPEHSKSAQSQYEMKTFRVVEDDVDVRSIWRQAQQAGFTDIKLAVFNVPPVHFNLDEFEDFLSGDFLSYESALLKYAEAVRGFMRNERNFFLFKGVAAASDSRFRAGLTARIQIEPAALEVKAGDEIVVHATITNDSKSIWLPRSAGLGAVHLGCHVYDERGRLLHQSYHWESLTPDEGRPIMPHETIEVDARMPTLPKGNYFLDFDMVSNDVTWFALNGSPQVRISVNVV